MNDAKRPPGRGRTVEIAVVQGRVTQMARAWAAGWGDVLRAPKLPDLLASLTVAAVAMPLNLALAVASGLPPASGLFAGAIGGALAAAFGGSSLQATGPAAALSLMVLGLSQRFGAVGVAAACLIIGVTELVLSFSGAGRLVRHVPESVLAGFTTGVGLTLLNGQIPELLGFGVHDYKTVDLAGMMHQPLWLHHVSWLAAVSGILVAFVVVSLQRFKRVPAAAIAVVGVTFISVYVGWDVERVHDIGAVPSTFPQLSVPVVPDEQWLDLLLATMPLALLAAVESLLSARAVDRMAPDARPHEPSLELFGQAVANVGVGLFSGMPVTGVVVRSGVNVQSGAKTRLAALLHGVLLAALALSLSDTIGMIPQAALAGLLCVIGFRLLEVGPFLEMLRHERLEAAAFVAAAGGTASGHLVSGLVLGGALHAARVLMERGKPAAAALRTEPRRPGIRAVLGRAHASARRTMHGEAVTEQHKWLGHLRHGPVRAPTSYVHPHATVIGRVVLSDHVHVAAGTSVRADEGTPFFFGPNTNVQDGVVVHALKDRAVELAGESWAVYVGRDVSIAHGALIHGPCYIGDHTFIGFKSVVHDSIIGAGCSIGIGAVVVGVEIPDGKFVPHGAIVDSADAVDRLPDATAHHREFNEDVVEVNRGLAAAYTSFDGAALPLRKAPPARPLGPPISPWEPTWATTSDKERF